jgi:hypothetical protein
MGPRERDVEDEFERYRGDALYEVWRRGGDPNQVDEERLRDHFDDGVPAEDVPLPARKRRDDE